MLDNELIYPNQFQGPSHTIVVFEMTPRLREIDSNAKMWSHD